MDKSERAALAQGEAQPVAWRDHVEQRIWSWKQRTMNRSGDHLAIGDFMGASDIDDLVDYVCDEYAEPPAPPPPAAPVVTDALGEAGYRILWSSGDRIYPEVFAAMRRLLTAALEAK